MERDSPSLPTIPHPKPHSQPTRPLTLTLTDTRPLLAAQFEVPPTEKETALLETLEPEFAAFQLVIDDASVTVEKAKDSFREKVKSMVRAKALLIATGGQLVIWRACISIIYLTAKHRLSC